MKKRILTLALCLALVLSITIPGTWATTEEPTDPTATTETTVTTDPTGETKAPSDPTGETKAPDASDPTGETKAPDPSDPTGETKAPDASDPTGETKTPDPSDPTGETKAPDATDPTESTGANDPTDPSEETTTPPCEYCGQTEDHAEDCLSRCTCDPKPAEGEPHSEGCPLYVEKTFDVEAVKAQILACETTGEIEKIVSELTEEEANALVSAMSEDELRVFAEKLGYNVEIETITPPVDYTAVGPLKPAVTVQAARPRMRFAARAPSEPEENGLILNKTAVFDADSKTIKITMEAYTTGTVTTQTDSTPCDIALVLDESGSMAYMINQYTEVYELNKSVSYYIKDSYGYVQVKWCSECNSWMSGVHIKIWFISFHRGSTYTPMTSESDSTSGSVQFYEASATSTSKKDALVTAANQFAQNVYNDAVTNDVDHRISVIGFSDSSTVKVGLNDDIRNNLSDVQSAINGLNTNGGTYIEKGLANAVAEFQNAPATSSTQRKRVVVVFTDGIPGNGTWSQSMGSANSAIQNAYTLKNTYGATVYSIGMLEDANPGLAISDEDDDTARTNKFLHYLSSNYPNAQSMTNGGTGSNAGYYLSASDTASLTSIFQKISQEIATPSIQLGSSTVIKDIITPYFEVPADASDINLYTMDYNGTDFDGTRDTATGVTATIGDDRSVSVTGFDYNANFVSKNQKSDGTYGKKLIIEFTVPVREGFLGGNDVPTNGDGSGVYLSNGTEVERFVNPSVNVPIATPTVGTTNVTIYEGGSVDTATLFEIPSFTGDDAWKAAYVDISSGVTNVTGDTVSPSDCTDYTATVIYKPKTDGSNSNGTANKGDGVSNTGTATVHVLKPNVTATVNDVQCYYGESHTLGTGVNSSINVNWTDKTEGHTEIPEATETAPYSGSDLTLAYSVPNQTSPISIGKTDVDVTVKVMNGANEIPATITTNCSYGCDNGATDGKYTVHVKTCQLTIEKSGGASGEPYVFTIYKGNDKYTEATVVGNGSVTIYELPVGTYTIKEDTGWSWRFSADNGNGANLTATAPTGEITCTNTARNDKVQWLNGFSEVVTNIFKSN